MGDDLDRLVERELIVAPTDPEGAFGPVERDIGRGHRIGDGDGKIQVIDMQLAQDVAAPVAADVKGNVRIGAGEIGDDALKISNRVIGGQTHPQRAHELSLVQVGNGAIIQAQHLAGIADKGVTLRCQIQNLALVMQELGAHQILQPLDLERNCRLRATQNVTGFSVVTKVHDGDKGADQVGLQIYEMAHD